MSVRIESDNTAEIIKEKDESVLRALEAVGIQAEGYAQLLTPVDTGLLRNSITHAIAGGKPALGQYKSNESHATTQATEKAGTAGKAVSPQTVGSYTVTTPKLEHPAVYVGTNVEYAPYVEYGTRRAKKQPFLQPAIQDHMDEYQQIFEKYLEEIK